MNINSLNNSLNYLHVAELKDICSKLLLSEKGKKGELILRVIRFIETGEKLVNLAFPKISCANPKQKYELSAEALMLKGAYKNDLKTRLFFKKYIGEYFHFTAFGIDWLNERWMQGNPPTHQEFANMWKSEYQRRKITPVTPKDEWAYINFVQDYYNKTPNAPRNEVMQAWEKIRNKHKNYIVDILANSNIIHTY